jgi:dihydroorotase-like cyclic amidohydrolase
MSRLPELVTTKGGVDPHVHFREPSTTNKSENFASGTRAAAYGGYVAVADMFNSPGRETKSLFDVLEKKKIIEDKAYVPIGIWFGIQPEFDNLDEIEKVSSYIVGGGEFFAHPSTGNENYYGVEDLRPIAQHWQRTVPEMPIGLHSGPDNLEEFIELAKEVGFYLHVCHVNNPDDVELIEEANRTGTRVSWEVCPHTLFLDEELVEDGDWTYRMQPRLVGKTDREKLLHQLLTSKISMLATDHAPHPLAKKIKAERENPKGDLDNSAKAFGVRSSSVALQVFLAELMKSKIGDDVDKIALFEELTSSRPARLLGIRVSVGSTVTRRMVEFEISPEDDYALPYTAPTPFIGHKALGQVIDVKIGRVPVIAERQLVTKVSKSLFRGNEI